MTGYLSMCGFDFDHGDSDHLRVRTEMLEFSPQNPEAPGNMNIYIT